MRRSRFRRRWRRSEGAVIFWVVNGKGGVGEWLCARQWLRWRSWGDMTPWDALVQLGMVNKSNGPEAQHKRKHLAIGLHQISGAGNSAPREKPPSDHTTLFPRNLTPQLGQTSSSKADPPGMKTRRQLCRQCIPCLSKIRACNFKMVIQCRTSNTRAGKSNISNTRVDPAPKKGQMCINRL